MPIRPQPPILSFSILFLKAMMIFYSFTVELISQFYMARVKYEFSLICNLIMEIPDRILRSKGFRTAEVKEKKQTAILINSCFNKIIHASIFKFARCRKESHLPRISE